MEKEKIANSTIYNQVRTILVQGIVVAQGWCEFDFEPQTGK